MRLDLSCADTATQPKPPDEMTSIPSASDIELTRTQQHEAVKWTATGAVSSLQRVSEESSVRTQPNLLSMASLEE